MLEGAGHTIQGAKAPTSRGIYLSGSYHVTIRNTKIKNFESGILLDSYSTYNSISGNELEGNDYGISCWAYSDSNSITGNNISGNNLAAVWIVGSSDINLIGNIIVSNGQYGISLESSSSDVVYHNSLIGNTIQVHVYDSNGTWDNGYPSGGNYWADNPDRTDSYKGPNQDQPGSDGICDIPYSINLNNQDRYPLASEYTFALVTDINKDGKVNIVDITIVAQAYGSSSGSARWNPICDLDHNGVINIVDITRVAKDLVRTT